MNIYKMRDTIRRCMLLLNFAMVFLLAAIFAITPSVVVRKNQGVVFLQSLNHLPAEPWKASIAVAGMVLLIAVSTIFHENRKRAVDMKAVYGLELLLGIMIIFALHMDYKGILLLIVVDLIDTMQEKGRFFFLGIMIFLYLLVSLDVTQSMLDMVSVTDYLSIYSMHIDQLTQSLIGLLDALNSILFICFMILLFSERTEENAKIRSLNSELEHANDRLSVMNEQLKAYAAESEHMAETRERNRLAREIHDTLGHSLTGITAAADACMQMLDISPEMARNQIAVIASTARQGMQEVRRSVKALRPDALERMELKSALGSLCSEIQKTYHAAIELEIETDNLRLSPDEEDTVYRTVQESITNAIRHGKANVIVIRIYCENRRLHIVVQDNGIGCDGIIPGFGLRHMKERLNLLNGTLKWNGEQGFRIEAMIPLRWGDEI